MFSRAKAIPLRSRVIRRLLSVHFSALITGALTVAVPLAAQSSELPPRWLDWDVNPFNSRGHCQLTKPVVDEMTRTLKQILSTFSRLEVTYPASTVVEPTVAVNSDYFCATGPLKGDADIAVWGDDQVVRPAGGAGRAKLKPHHSESGGAIWMLINGLPKLGDVFMGPPTNLSPGSIVIFAPTSTFQGFPVIDKSTLVITPPGHPPLYIPVPLERALKLAVADRAAVDAVEVADAQKEAARYADGSEYARVMTAQQFQDMKKGVLEISASRVKDSHAILELLRTRLAQLTPTTRNAPAYVTRDPVFSSFIPQADSGNGAQAVMMPNPEYFDRKVARTVPQLLLVSLSRGCIDEVAQCGSDGWQSRIIRQVDWAAFAKKELH